MKIPDLYRRMGDLFRYQNEVTGLYIIQAYRETSQLAKLLRENPNDFERIRDFLLKIYGQIENPAYEFGHGLYRVLHRTDQRLIVSALEDNVRRTLPLN